MDTEGHLVVRPSPIGAYQPFMSEETQEKAALEDYCEGARRDGVQGCTVKTRPGDPTKSDPIITRADMIAKEIRLTHPLIRAKKRKGQIKRFKEAMEAERKIKPRPEIIQASKELEALELS